MYVPFHSTFTLRPRDCWDGCLLVSELPERERWEVEEEEEKKRRDLRETHLVFSIDPQGCEDVDDTLSVRYYNTLPLITQV